MTKIITNFNISKEDIQHSNIINKIFQIIQNLDNSTFKTLLTFIINANLDSTNIQEDLTNGITIIDETEQNEYLIEMKDGFFCISILNCPNEQYNGEMVTFQCSGMNDILVTIIDEDVLELQGNETAEDKRKIIIET